MTDDPQHMEGKPLVFRITPSRFPFVVGETRVLEKWDINGFVIVGVKGRIGYIYT